MRTLKGQVANLLHCGTGGGGACIFTGQVVQLLLFTTGHFLQQGSETRFLAEECGFFAPQGVSRTKLSFRQGYYFIPYAFQAVA